MGSLRNPIGPLPSSIYWRRRAVLLSVVGVLALLVVWAVTSGGGSGTGGSGTPDGKGPAPSITPGPSGSGPAISEQPGGRDESGEGGGSGEGSGSGSDSGSGSGSGAGAGDSGDVGGATGDVGENGVVDGSGKRVPAGAALANCTPTQVMWTLRSVSNEYEPGQKPKFELIAENTSSTPCKLDVGPEGTILTITQAESGDVLWASDDCPSGPGHVFLKVAQGGKFTHAVKWDRKPSEEQCATPRPGSAEPGTYLVEAKTPGMPKVRASFVLKEA